MRILLLESDALAPWFRELGHSVLSILWKNSSTSTEGCICVKVPLYYQDLQHIFAMRQFEPDMVLWHDMGNIPRVWGLEALSCPTIGYFIDTFCNPWHVPYSAAFDQVLTAQKNTVSFFQQDKLPRPVSWTPLYYLPTRAFHNNEQRDIPVSFVGTVSGIQNRLRHDFLKGFQKHFPLIIKQGAYQPIFARSRIVLNQSVAGEINYRTFEAAACGAAVLNEDVDNGFLDLFEPGVNMLPRYTRNNARHAAMLAQTMLRHEKRLQEIASAGEQLVRERHSAPARCREILDCHALLEHAPALRHSLNERIRQLMVLACRFIIGDASSNLDTAILNHFKLLEKSYFTRWKKLSSLRGKKTL